MQDLEQIVKRLKSGEVSVFDEFYDRTNKIVFYSVLAIVRDKSKAEDIVQDTYLRFLQQIHRYQERHIVGYLVTMAKRLAINEYQSQKRVVYTGDDLDFLDNYALVGHVEIEMEHQAIIQKALSVLDENERNVVIMHTIDQLTHREIALALDKPIGTITWLYQRAVKKMKAAVKED